MGILGAIPGIGAGLDAIGGIASAVNARNAFKHRYQDTVKDIKAAGLNPSLAYGQGGGNPQTSDLPQVGEGLARGVQSIASAGQAKATAAKTAAETGLLLAQTADLNRKVAAEATTAEATAGIKSIDSEKAHAQYQVEFTPENYPKWVQAVLSDLQGRIAEGQRAVTAAEQAGYDRDIAKIQRHLVELGVPQAEAEAGFYKSTPGKYSPYITKLLEIVSKFVNPSNILSPSAPRSTTFYLPRGK